MNPATNFSSAITRYVHHDDTLPLPQLRKLGLIYSSYRFVVSLFSMLMLYISARTGDSASLPSFLQQTTLSFYVLLSLILLGLFYVVRKHMRRQLAFGLALDVIILSLLLYTTGNPDLQLTMLYMVVVAASFMLLHGSQALVITLLAIILVIYQQFFYAIANSMSLANLGDALLMSASFLAVGGLSWSISQRLVQLEKVAANHAKEVERLNVINQEVITQMVNGVIVIDKQHVVLANLAAHQLLSLSLVTPVTAQNTLEDVKETHSKALLSNFEQQLNEQHSQLFNACLSVASGQSRAFTYDVPAVANASIFGKLRVQIIPLKDDSKLVILEDLRREQASAQQLKLASLGQLTASIAHEIRNPLAAISQASQLLMEDVAEQMEDGSASTSESNTAITGNHELYEMIFSQTKRVNRIIEDILKLSRQQTATQQVLELAEWMPSFLENYFQGHDIFLRMKTKPIISFDTHQLEQILINLINNGLRYSSYAHPHAYVEIDIYCADNDVIIDILDNGNGVSTGNLELLFDPFFTTDKAGTGLGLYLSQAFCEANQARLLYIPEHEKTCFRLIVPSIKSDNKFQTIEENLT
ncbi:MULTISPECIES: sensor histidine kinase [Psychrobacter]|jgi:two-component system sensor histidine kinase PilS (NtrC family)|uniref:sensor histidine kinase n=1 Tax=Psychrobacter TaxID=497 RepID=UPI00086CB4A5|nr:MULTISPECIES: ATP-binding protein [Psychrobacter]MBA6244474.1 two-component sensor histidine kinase [Psychrobacter sp. Urea-trap-18]MBA6287026.1 two-component sensor histidine kinase [Psychrobacter sp. Urea-trap-16]MBA6319269.1 two-component sensor histidine kinase [Psychrobacter sp. Urea-trap-20]MBA6335555.1 two-component sensor histidine kinase [Psychrobacter sp. Urea-trap-19]OEH67130.1 MAG: two-component sensor histidine kinase [Psychrobacter sp. B29-1]|tara:strand:+ start:17730 stop:19487 length:1758 start_codon:yes stop_codon:yes gene_type:complete